MINNIEFNFEDEKYYNGGYFEDMQNSYLLNYKEESKLHRFLVIFITSLVFNGSIFSLITLIIYNTRIIEIEMDTIMSLFYKLLFCMSWVVVFNIVRTVYDKENEKEKKNFQKEVIKLVNLKRSLKDILVECSNILEKLTVNKKQHEIIFQIYTILNEIYDIQWYFKDIPDLEVFKKYLKAVQINNEVNVENKKEKENKELLEEGQFLLDDLVLTYSSYSLEKLLTYFKIVMGLESNTFSKSNIFSNRDKNKAFELCYRWNNSHDDSVILAKMYKYSTYEDLYNLVQLGQNIIYFIDNPSEKEVQEINKRIETLLIWTENFVDRI